MQLPLERKDMTLTMDLPEAEVPGHSVRLREAVENLAGGVRFWLTLPVNREHL